MRAMLRPARVMSPDLGDILSRYAAIRAMAVGQVRARTGGALGEVLQVDAIGAPHLLHVRAPGLRVRAALQALDLGPEAALVVIVGEGIPVAPAGAAALSARVPGGFWLYRVGSPMATRCLCAQWRREVWWGPLSHAYERRRMQGAVYLGPRAPMIREVG